MIEVSVIIPIYKGDQYYEYLTNILTINFEKYFDKYRRHCEAIFVNDCPEEKMVLDEDRINIRIYDMNTNLGIHGARAFGCNKAKGEFVLFLDQDDKIEEDYLVKQREHIEASDAVVCMGYRENVWLRRKSPIYANKERFEMVKKFKNYFIGNRIISPGQVLLRKSSIPDIWLKKTLRYNGADDFLLWFIMLKKGCDFALNEVSLYTHIEHEMNTSNDKESMYKSELEAISIMRDSGYFNNDELKKLAVKAEERIYQDRSLRLVKLYNYWMYLNARNMHIDSYFEAKKYKRIAIYGLDYMGNRLYDELMNSDVDIVFGIDRQAEFIHYDNLPVITLDSEDFAKCIHKVDAVVVTAVVAYHKIRMDIRELCDTPVISIENIIYELIKNANL